MAYFAAQIANYFIERGRTENVQVDPLKVQKLVYMAHGWHLAFEKAPLIRETVEAWKYGPVVPDLYREFKNFRYSTIDASVPVPSSATPLDPRTTALLDEVWAKYGHMSGITLSAITHESGYAWELARRGSETNWSSPEIPNAWIQDEFERRRAKG